MAKMKCVALIRAETANKKSGSWSEVYYINSSAINSAYNSFFDLMTARMRIASAGMKCFAFKITDLDSPGVSQGFTLGAALVGGSGGADTPWQTLTALAKTGTGNKRVMKWPGMPDGQIVSGGYSPTPFYTPLVTGLFTKLVADGWGLYGEDLNNARVDVLEVDATGAYIFSGATTAAENENLKFYRTRFTDGTPVSGLWRVKQVLTPTTGTLFHWPAGKVVKKGKVFKYSRSIKIYTGFEDLNISKRNLGRDFFQFVGRRSRTA